jgi:hypothetical protein
MTAFIEKLGLGIGATLCVLVVGWCLYGISGYRKDDRGYQLSEMGFRILAATARHSTGAYGYSTNSYLDFVKFLQAINVDTPSIVDETNEGNPFPGVLPKERRYQHLAGHSGVLPGESVPLLWDATPSSRRTTVVLFSDLTIREVPKAQLPLK